MSELSFPLVGALLVFFVVVPLLTVLARGSVAVLPRAKDSVAAQESPWRLWLVIGPTLGPLIWLISAAIHQSEEDTPLSACLREHLGTELCRDVMLFGALLLTTLSLGVLNRFRGDWGFQSRATGTCRTALANQRVNDICLHNERLLLWAPRVSVVERGVAPACTRGLFRPRVELDVTLLDGLDDDELEATLLHEVEHAAARDPLRFFTAQVALSLNPIGFLLQPELARYHFAREALCDRRAVQHGADPLALARSIVCAASSSATLPVGVSALGGHGVSGVCVRVQLLLGYATDGLGPAQRRAPFGLVTTLVTLLAVWPHLLGAELLDSFHRGVERAALTAGMG